MSKWTPGPWEYQWYADRYAITGKGERMNCLITEITSGLTLQEQDANARLIAACPQMVEALREMLKYGLAEDWNKKHPNVMYEARAALVAAEEGK